MSEIRNTQALRGLTVNKLVHTLTGKKPVDRAAIEKLVKILKG
jgi:hypothetical protein